MPNITDYVYEKVFDNGNVVLSFQMNQYVLGKLMEVPLGAYVQIAKCHYSDRGSHSLYWTVPRQKPVEPAPEVHDDEVPF